MRLERACVKALYIMAVHGPIAWAAQWNERARISFLHEVFGVRPMSLRGVLPWGNWPKAGWVESCESSATPSPSPPENPRDPTQGAG